MLAAGYPPVTILLSLEYSGRFVVSPADGEPTTSTIVSEEELQLHQQHEQHRQKRRSAAEELASARSSFKASQPGTPTNQMPSTSSQTPSGPGTPGSSVMVPPRITADTSSHPDTPGSTGSEHSTGPFYGGTDSAALPRCSVSSVDRG